jgi:hypothetical protein
MRIAAGIILIVAAIINVIAGAGYVLGGGVATVGGAVLEEAVKEGGKEAGADATEVAKASEEMSKVTSFGTGLLVFGLFLWVMFVLQIVGAVFLFISKSKMFIFVVAGLSVVAEVVGIVITTFGWTNIFGIVGGVLAFIGAAAIGKAAAAPPPAAPAAPQG